MRKMIEENPTPETSGTIREQNERIRKAAEAYDQEVSQLLSGPIEDYRSQTGGTKRSENIGRRVPKAKIPDEAPRPTVKVGPRKRSS